MTLLLLAACTLSPEGVDRFWFRNDGADMPVHVRGAPEADTLILYLAGGPGDPGLLGPSLFPEVAAELEREHLVAYWDQRSSGIAQGHASAASLTVAQFVEDTEVLVDILQAEYAPERLVFFSHSWGGGLGSAYLTDPDRAADVALHIETNGAHDMVLGMELSREWAVARAEAVRSEDPDLADRAAAFYGAHPTIGADAFLEHAEIVVALDGVLADPADAYGGFVGDALFGPMDASFFTNSSRTVTAMREEVVQLDVDLESIPTPTLLVWGAHDGLIPIGVAERGVERLPDATLARIEEAAHVPHSEAPEAWLAAVQDFLASR